MLITYQAKLLEKNQLTHDIYFFKFERPTNPTWTFKPGQYMIVHVPQGEGPTARRLYSIFSRPNDPYIELLVEIIPGGLAGTYLPHLNVGDMVTLQGPAGIFTLKETPHDEIFLATGTGIVPMRSMIKDRLMTQTQGTTNFELFWGLKNCKDLYYFDEFKQLAEQYPQLKFHLCLSRENECDVKLTEEDMKYITLGRVTAGLEEKISPERQMQAQYYLCGSKEIVESLKTYLADKDIPKEQVHFEKFT